MGDPVQVAFLGGSHIQGVREKTPESVLKSRVVQEKKKKPTKMAFSVFRHYNLKKVRKAIFLPL